ncbi:hypothetical protein AGMMS49546_24410 [Spirochaetia bacterium]|nr:hypothetical protein AGMMS49546_24410 [Spirochaetia bacterium]
MLHEIHGGRQTKRPYRYLLIAAAVLLIAGCATKQEPKAAGSSSASGENVSLASLAPTAKAGGSKVYFTGDISGKGLMAVYQALKTPVSGKVAVKLHMGEPGNENYLRPEIVRDLVLSVNGSLVDSNTYYGGPRALTAGHLLAARDHGFTFAPVDILDADGDVRVPINGGFQLKEAILGKHIMDYDWIISVAHFKGHAMAGFGGTFKNLAIGIASPRGKKAIHDNEGGGMFSSSGEVFFEKIIDYNAGLMQARKGRMLYINVLNNLSISCDCDARAPHADMADIGIMASLDPVALEKASLDQIYARPEEERKHLVERIESLKGTLQVIYAEKAGLGSQHYELINL